MKRTCGLMLAGVACLTLTACEQPGGGGGTAGSGAAFQKLTYEQALVAAREQKKVVMIDFGTAL